VIDRSELYSDEGTVFGHQGIGAWTAQRFVRGYYAGIDGE
jgi:hypothetical protein